MSNQWLHFLAKPYKQTFEMGLMQNKPSGSFYLPNSRVPKIVMQNVGFLVFLGGSTDMARHNSGPDPLTEIQLKTLLYAGIRPITSVK